MAVQIYSFVKDAKGVFRPWIPVRLSNPTDASKSIIIHALLDTGADECVFTKAVAEQSGYSFDDPTVLTKEMQGVSQEKIKVWFYPFKIELLTPDMKKSFWTIKSTVVGCVQHDNILPILGFSNCMSNFKIQFNYATRKIILDDRPAV
jgi:hypothetical protein